MKYKLSETEVLTQPSEYIDESQFNSLSSYETTDGNADGGYLDSFNSLKKQVDYNYYQYKEQLRSLAGRADEVLANMKYARNMMLIVFAIPVIYTLLLQLFMHLGVRAGLFAALYVILYGLFFAVVFVSYVLVLPGMIKNFINLYGQYKALNSGGSMKNYRKSNDIISFQDEKEFLKKTIREYDSFYEEVMVQGLDKRDGALGGNDSGVLTGEQTVVLNKMRSLSVFRDYKASVAETRKEVGIGTVLIAFMIITAVLLIIFVYTFNA